MSVIRGSLFVVLTICTGLIVRTEMLSRPQAASAPLKFEVASIKPHAPVPSDATNRGGGGSCHGADSFYPANLMNAPPPLGRCVFTRITLKGLIQNAYKPPKGPIFGLGRMQDISGGPAWLDADTWDVQAKAEDDKATEVQLREMLQTLLADRFQLRFYHEARQEQGYVLVVAKGGLHIKPEPGDDWRMTATAGKASFVKYTMPLFASFVAQFVAAPVDDRTGLEGGFTFDFSTPPRLAAASNSDADNGPSIFTALQEQLGLRLNSQKVPVDVWVVDHVEKPPDGDTKR